MYSRQGVLAKRDKVFEDYSEFALAHACRAGIPAARVINTWPPGKLGEWAKRESARR